MATTATAEAVRVLAKAGSAVRAVGADAAANAKRRSTLAQSEAMKSILKSPAKSVAVATPEAQTETDK